MKAGIVIDAWKIDIFKRHLKAAGFTHTDPANIRPDVLILTVETVEPQRLMQVVKEANTEAARVKAEDDLNKRLRN